MIRAIIFDFDGVILDAETNEFNIWNDLFRRHHCQLNAADWAPMIGGSGPAFDVVAELRRQMEQVPFESFNAGLLKAELTGLAHQHQRDWQPMPGVTSLITAAKAAGLKLGIASNAQRQFVRANLATFELGNAFACIRTIEDTRRPKPHPSLYRAVLNGLGVRAEEAIAIEDSPAGVQAAKWAGVRNSRRLSGVSFDASRVPFGPSLQQLSPATFHRGGGYHA